MTLSFFVKILLVTILLFGPFGPVLAVEKNETIIAVIDSGIYGEHPILDGIVISSWDLVLSAPRVFLRSSHGTRVAGIIKHTVGDAPVKILDLVACDERECFANAAAEAIRYAVDNRASVINISLVSNREHGYVDTFDDAIRYAHSRGVLIVAAAGNDGLDLDTTPLSPVCNDNGEDMVLGVGVHDLYGARVSWSNYGSCVDMFAPGTDIVAATVPMFDNVAFVEVSGSSYAAALVAARAALLKTGDPRLSAKDIIDLLKGGPKVAGANTAALRLVFGQDKRTVYLVQDGFRHGFPDSRTFLAHGYDFRQVRAASPMELLLPEGPLMRPLK